MEVIQRRSNKAIHEYGYIGGHHFEYSQAMMANGRFMITKSLGKGSFGEIFQGIDTLTNQEVAIKMVFNQGFLL